MGWMNGDHDSYVEDSEYTLSTIFQDPKHEGKTDVMYEYDFGDGLEHSIKFLGLSDPTLNASMGFRENPPVLVSSGQGSPVAEGCGGTVGWQELKALFQDTGAEPGRRRQWYRGMCSNGNRQGLDAHKWDIEQVKSETSGTVPQLSGSLRLPPCKITSMKSPRRSDLFVGDSSVRHKHTVTIQESTIRLPILKE